jgi:uncharacterized cupredoxin-like copper-binding protein
MSFSRGLTARIALALASAAPLAACKKQAPPAAAPQVVVIRTTDYAFAMPDTIQSGVVHFKLVNGGPSLHHAAIARITQGRTWDSVVAVLHGPPGPPPAWVEFVGSPNITAPTGLDTVEVVDNLQPGLYVVLCVIPDSAGVPHFAHGMMKQLTVVAASGPGEAEPTADVQVTLSDFDFTFDKPLTAGRHVIKISNAAPQAHEMVIVQLDSGATAQGFVHWVDTGMKGRPQVTPRGGVVGLAPGGSTYLVVNLPAGNYGLVCFLPDAHDGKEHTKHGMVKQIAVN